jgi:hypothetical protein
LCNSRANPFNCGIWAIRWRVAPERTFSGARASSFRERCVPGSGPGWTAPTISEIQLALSWIQHRGSCRERRLGGLGGCSRWRACCTLSLRRRSGLKMSTRCQDSAHAIVNAEPTSSRSLLQEACEVFDTLERGLVELDDQYGDPAMTGRLLSTLRTLRAKAVALGVCERLCAGDEAAPHSVHPAGNSQTQLGGPAQLRLYEIVIRFAEVAEHSTAYEFLEQVAAHGDLIEVETLYGRRLGEGTPAAPGLGFRIRLRSTAQPAAVRALCLRVPHARDVQLTQLASADAASPVISGRTWCAATAPSEGVRSEAGPAVGQIADLVFELAGGLCEMPTATECVECLAAHEQLRSLGRQLREQVLYLRKPPRLVRPSGGSL